MQKFTLILLAVAAFCTPSRAADTVANLPQAEILPIAFDERGVSGPGGERLKSELPDAQFVAIGEDHGFAEPPMLARALAVDMRRLKHPLFHAAEIGPSTAQWLRRQFGEKNTDLGLKAVGAAIKGKGLAMPFTSNVEDARLAADFLGKDGKSRLWGIDQEFMGSPMILLEGLASTSSDRAIKQELKAISDADQVALRKLAFNEAWLSTAEPENFDALETAFSKDAQAVRLLKQLSDSAKIYQLNNIGAYQASNERRSALMQGYFLQEYRRAGPSARVVLKMGAYHLGRGTTPVGIYDLGSLLPGLAAANGLKSLHIAYLPIGGNVRSISPSETAITAVKPYQDEGIGALLAVAGFPPEAVPASGYVLIPLANIRQRLSGAQRRELPEIARFVVTGFDYLVTTRDAKAATHFEAWVPDAGIPGNSGDTILN